MRKLMSHAAMLSVAQLKYLIIIRLREELTYPGDAIAAVLLSFRPTQLSSLKPKRAIFLKANLNRQV